MESWFSRGLQKWYEKHRRDLPWRQETDPYKIWLSEIILQQTQVAQGLSYYLRFTQNYPQVQNLAEATEDQVLKDWQGLGYYSRARNLHETAKQIVNEQQGVFPGDYKSLKELKGVGDYTAAAIASFAYNQPHAVVDGNVYRLLSRLFGIETAIDSSEGKKEFFKLAEELLDCKNPARHNQAIMEFGSQWCKPIHPKCPDCIFKEKCFAFNNEIVDKLPVKAKKTKVRKRYFTYVVAVDKKKNVIINKRAANDIWKGLYEFPLIESEKEIKEKDLFKHPSFKNVAGNHFSLLHQSKSYKHVLSHQHLHAKFYVIFTKNIFKAPVQTSALNSLKNLAFPRLIEKFLNDCQLDEISYF
ncbi:MAG: A/G-specific adenine glycosylase [Bacteroidetes bacterium]|nr:A/G-specific adenine glycosylase [Bacteroidota bacterium]